MMPVLALDHVIIAVRDLEAAAEEMCREYGLVALAGGAPAPGLRNRIIPLAPPQYLELLAPDPASQRDASSRWIESLAGGAQRLAWWAVRTDEIDGVAARTGRPARSSSALEPAGSMGGGWRSVWPTAGATSGLPFFIQYNIAWDEQLRVREAGYARAASPAAPGAITRLDVSCDPTMLRAWLDVEIPTDALPIELTVGAAALTSIRIASPRGDIVIRG